MVYFVNNDLKKQKTPWGKQVSCALTERDLKQNDVVRYLQDKGFDIDKVAFHHLLYGIGVSAREKEIDAINELLGFKISNAKES